MGVGLYFTDEELACNLRPYFESEKRFTIDFKSWFAKSKQTSQGFVVQVEDRRFLIDVYTGLVLRELK